MTTQPQAALRAIREVLGDNLIAVYLHGSSVLGGLRPASDLDLLVVIHRSLDGGERFRLLQRVGALSGPGSGGRSLEVTVVVRGDVVPWRYPPLCDFLYGDWLVTGFERDGPPVPEPLPNLAIEIAQVLAVGRVLHGPNAASVLDPVPDGDVVRASVAGIDGLLAELSADTRNVLLTLARIWLTVETGAIAPKDEAAAWAAARLSKPACAVLEHARWLYLNATYAAETWPAGLRQEATACAEQIVAATRSGTRSLRADER